MCFYNDIIFIINIFMSLCFFIKSKEVYAAYYTII